jgi:hypothetical protein
MVLDPIVDQGLFARAQLIMEDHYLSLSDDEMLLRLRLLLKRKGMLNTKIINNAAGVPSVGSYVKHFGSLRKVFTRIGYTSPRDCDWIDTRQHWSEVIVEHAKQIAVVLNASKYASAKFDETNSRITVKGMRICLQVARHLKRKTSNHAAAWRVYRRNGRSGLLVVLRLNETNKAVVDYLVLPPAKQSRPYLYFSDRGGHGAARVDTKADVVAIIKNQLKRMSCLASDPRS